MVEEPAGVRDLEGDPNQPGHEECMIQDPDTGHRILFVEVPEEKQTKNRLHFDLRPRESSRDEEDSAAHRHRDHHRC
jgi:hypothetical protein